jgi:capsular polysaccharide transport system permease protein
VAQAEQQDQAALAAISRWRIEHGNVDPTADATMLLNQVGLLESSLSTAEVNLVKIKALRNPDHPMLVPAQRQVDALRGRLYEIRSRLSGNGDTPAAQLKTYIELTNQQAFADSNVMQARQNYQQSFTNAMALQRYLSIIARPVSETRSSIPNPPVVMILAFGIGCALAAAHNLIRALYRSFRHA